MEAVKTFLCLTTLALSLVLAGCGRSQPPPDIRPPIEAGTPQPDSTDQEESAGLFHIVEPGQTLYWISRHYGVSVEELVRVNHLSNPDELYVDQRIFVPGAPAPTWSWPVPGGEILSYFGERRSDHRHTGLDIRGRRGQEVLAVRSGRVLYSSSMRDYGRTIILDHGDGLRSLYAHNSKLLVQRGQQVYRGQAIARVGQTGNATTEHCHFEIRRGEVPVDPLPYLRQ
jgi:murein DD-endopeptidase MepM/ murein hydrolase activator NlpD